jgi:hypothetical protein
MPDNPDAIDIHCCPLKYCRQHPEVLRRIGDADLISLARESPAHLLDSTPEVLMKTCLKVLKAVTGESP